jgi:toxin YoeB
VRLVFEDQGWEDYRSWLEADREMLARINKLIEDVRRDPDEHRLVYVVTEAEVIILAARYHY